MFQLWASVMPAGESLASVAFQLVTLLAAFARWSAGPARSLSIARLPGLFLFAAALQLEILWVQVLIKIYF